MNQSNQVIVSLFGCCSDAPVPFLSSAFVAWPTLMGCICWRCHTHAQWDHTEFDTTSTRLKLLKSIHLTHQLQLFLCLCGRWKTSGGEGGVKETEDVKFLWTIRDINNSAWKQGLCFSKLCSSAKRCWKSEEEWWWDPYSGLQKH